MNDHGFTFIEVLVAMSLLAFALLNIAGLQLSAVRKNQEEFMNMIAMEQLRSLVAVMQMQVVNFSDFYMEWARDNQQLLPGGYGQVIKIGSESIVRIHWRSASSYQWNCSSKSIVGYSCLELKVLR